MTLLMSKSGTAQMFVLSQSQESATLDKVLLIVITHDNRYPADWKSTPRFPFVLDDDNIVLVATHTRSGY